MMIGLGLVLTIGLGYGCGLILASAFRLESGSTCPAAAQGTAGVASRAWVLPLHSLLAPEAQLKVLGLDKG